MPFKGRGRRPIAAAGLRSAFVTSTHTVLSLSGSPRARADALFTLLDRLLVLVADHAPGDASLQPATFRVRVAAWREALDGEDHPARLEPIVDEVAEGVAEFLGRVRAYGGDREAELLDVVRVLRDVVEAVKGDAMHFEHELMRSTTALDRMVEIEDLRELKRSLTREVRVLREAVAEHRAHQARRHEHLTTRVQTLERSLVQAQAAATDALTALPNRGAFDAELRAWVDRAAAEAAPFVLAMVDLDDFKRINDTYGHPVGDRVIVAAAQVLQAGLDAGEVAARYGGEEFALLLRATSAQRGRQRVTAMLESVPASYEYDVDGQPGRLSFAFSGGVTAWTPGDTAESIVKRADEALYDAKRRGKRRVESRPQAFLRGLLS